MLTSRCKGVRKSILSVFSVVSAAFFGFFLVASFSNGPLINSEDEGSTNPLDGCYHVYLDVGSNVGIQVRKLYEPQLFEKAAVHEVFDKYFDRKRYTNLTQICSVGFEPNPNHIQRLRGIENSYRKCGWNVRFHTNSAVSDRDGLGQFYSDHEYNKLEWGGSIIGPEGHAKKQKPQESFTKVRLLRLSSLVNSVVATRKVPPKVHPQIGPPKVVMKMDIEGSEVDVIPDLLFMGSLRHIDVIMVEFHEWMAKTEQRKSASTQIQLILATLNRFSQNVGQESKNRIEFVKMDDESYFDSNFNLPNCSSKIS